MSRGRPVDADCSAYGPDFALLREIWELQNIKATGWAYCGNSHLAALPELRNAGGRPAHTDAVSRRLRNLERRGLIERTIARGNYRRVRVTHRGRRALGPRVVRGGIRLRQATRPRTQVTAPGRQALFARRQALQTVSQAPEPGLVRTQQPTHSTHGTCTRSPNAPEKRTAAPAQTQANRLDSSERTVLIATLGFDRLSEAERVCEAEGLDPTAKTLQSLVQLPADPDSDAGCLLLATRRKLSPGNADLVQGAFLREHEGRIIFADALPERLQVLLKRLSDRVSFERVPGQSGLTRQQFWAAS